ncbi:patatin-like phospholipase family protein [Gramella sp. AN32]|uniref:Patatin family protein n=1 Tax=Christiangramia antarctica TaxID=2058158 RepID=A0ABW5X2C9_9FLAO|nr:patatin-like phospholipase family protein [Gramella sp. AN32]MCM4157970.1 patatin [Gramella sp. AN32]
MRALVISGGGSKGAFAGGIAEFLINDCQKHYDIFLGTSTGSLLIPLLSIGEISRLKAIYTSVSQKDIFSSNPFIITKKDGEFVMRINHFSILKMFLKGSKSFGESKSLRKLICDIITKEDFHKMKQNKSEVVVTVANLSYNRVEYKRLKDWKYHDFCDWVWASSNMVPFMSLLTKDGNEYADGGMGNIVPISEAINRGACDIDVIVLKTEQPSIKKKPVKNALELTTRAFDFMINQIIVDDVTIGNLQSKHTKVNLNFYYPPELLTKNSLIFDPDLMKDWWQKDYEFAQKNNPHCTSIEPKIDEL